MSTTRTYPLPLYLGACAAVLVIAWLALVPRFTTGSTFLWMATVALALYAVTLMSLRSGQSTESVAHILHDAETDVDGGRKTAPR